MSEQNTTPPDSLELAKDAINYALKRIADDENLRYHAGAFTEMFERLKVAHCALTGISADDVELVVFGRDLKRKAAAVILDEIKDIMHRTSGRSIADSEALQKIAAILGL